MLAETFKKAFDTVQDTLKSRYFARRIRERNDDGAVHDEGGGAGGRAVSRRRTVAADSEERHSRLTICCERGRGDPPTGRRLDRRRWGRFTRVLARELCRALRARRLSGIKTGDDDNDAEPFEILGEVGAIMTLDDGRIGIVAK